MGCHSKKKSKTNHRKEIFFRNYAIDLMNWSKKLVGKNDDNNKDNSMAIVTSL